MVLTRYLLTYAKWNWMLGGDKVPDESYYRIKAKYIEKVREGKYLNIKIDGENFALMKAEKFKEILDKLED